MRLLSFFAASAAIHTAVYAAQPYSTWMADSFIARSAELNRTYQAAVLDRGFDFVYNKTHNETYWDYITASVPDWLSDNGTLSDYNATYFSLDDIRIGTILLRLYARTNETKYKAGMEVLRDQLNRQPRNPSGGFWHRSSYPNQMWLDGLFMAEPFYAQYTATFDADNTTAWDDIVLQFDLIHEHCTNTTTNLLVHGYDESKTAVWADPVTGASPNVWDRALGWYALALLDVLDWLPSGHEGVTKLEGYFTSVAEGIKNSQDESGGWWLVMNEPYPGMTGNYIESSGTAMFTAALLKGIRVGYIEKADYFDVAERAYNLMTSRFAVQNGTELNWEGTVVVGSLSGNASFEYYISQTLLENDYKGAGPFIYAAYEYELATANGTANATTRRF